MIADHGGGDSGSGASIEKVKAYNEGFDPNYVSAILELFDKLMTTNSPYK